MPFIFYRQLNEMDCGPTCIRMVARYYGKNYNGESLRRIAGFNRTGVSLLGLSNTAEKIGLRTRGVRLTYEQLVLQAPLPCILHWNSNHFVTLVSVRKNTIKIADPASKNCIFYTKSEFLKHWISGKSIDENANVGIALLMTPSPDFYSQNEAKGQKLNWGRTLQYLIPHKKSLLRVLGALFITSFLQLLFPFFSQSVVDKGINGKNIPFIITLLTAQLVLTLTMTFVDFTRYRILIRLSNSINMYMLSDFWIKLTRIPLSYYETHSTGDTIQRINDNRQIQDFLTGTALNTLFSLAHFILYSILLLWYNSILFIVFSIGSIIYFGWVEIFQHFRRRFNHEDFILSSLSNNATLQMVQGMSDIKQYGAEKLMRWKWENIQAQQFKLTYKRLNYSQFQQTGALLINRLKNIVITFLVASMVVEGRLTFGGMFAIQYIVGQIDSPIKQLVGFIQSFQDARISMERLNEIHELEDEEPINKVFLDLNTLNGTINITNLSFSYPGTGDELVLKNINLKIPKGKVTAIVGMSGSGKTTFLRLLLKYYQLEKGEIKIGDTNLLHFRTSDWRKITGVVMQDGFIFNATIEENIALGAEEIDLERLVECCRMANILSYIESLPNGFYTKLGQDGTDVSQGQKQRILIARAIYKDPNYLFFDEATNALDANNEKTIVENLNKFFEGRTVVVVAHRLSTVMNADKIVVLEDGEIKEEGVHKELLVRKGRYFELVKNQLELGN